MCWGPGRRSRRLIVLGNQGYSGEYKYLAQPDPAGGHLLCQRQSALRASISEHHMAFQSLIHFTFHRVVGIFPFTIKELWEENEVTHQQDKARAEMVLPVTALGKLRPASGQPHPPLKSDAIWVC